MARSKVQLADGTVLMDISDSTATSQNMLSGTVAYGADGVRVVGGLVIAPLSDLVDALFPVGAIYTTASSTAPTFGGTWREVQVTHTWNDLANGDSNYQYGTGNGNLHYWKRIS